MITCKASGFQIRAMDSTVLKYQILKYMFQNSKHYINYITLILGDNISEVWFQLVWKILKG